MAVQGNKEVKTEVITYYKILSVAMFLLGVGMLSCGIVATINKDKVDDEVFGPPYFVGGYIVCVMAFLSALMCTLISMRAADVTDDLKTKKKLTHAMFGHLVVSSIMTMGCFVSVVFAGTGGFVTTENMSPLNKKLALAILTGCIIGMVLTIVSFCTVCKYGQFFCGSLSPAYRARTAFVNTNHTTAPGNGINMNATTFQSAHVNNVQASGLQTNNWFLKTHLNQQQQAW